MLDGESQLLSIPYSRYDITPQKTAVFNNTATEISNLIFCVNKFGKFFEPQSCIKCGAKVP